MVKGKWEQLKNSSEENHKITCAVVYEYEDLQREEMWAPKGFLNEYWWLKVETTQIYTGS